MAATAYKQVAIPYESQVITIEGLKTEEDVDTTLTEITIGVTEVASIHSRC